MHTLTITTHLTDESMQRLEQLTTKYNEWLREQDAIPGAEMSPAEWLAASINAMLRYAADQEL